MEQVPASELEARLGAAFGPSPVAVTLLAQERVEVGVADTTVWAQPDSAAARAQAIARWTWAHYAERAGVRAIWAAFGTTAERPAMAAHRGLLIMYSAKQLRALARAGRAP